MVGWRLAISLWDNTDMKATSRGRNRFGLPLVAASLVVLALLTAPLAVGRPGPTPPLPPPPPSFSQVWATQDNGAIRLFGNSNMTCTGTSVGGANPGASCSQAQTGTGMADIWNYNNNAYSMAFIDLDASATTTSNSTSASVAVPAGSTVLYARLYWGGNTGGALSRTSVKLQAPGGVYQTLTATSSLTQGSTYYQSAVDVTAIVRSAGDGTYWVGDISSQTGTNRFAGWGLVVAYRNPAEPYRDLTVSEGLDQVSGSDVDTLSISGFLTPRAGTVNASIGLVAWEGDLGIIGDQMKIDSTVVNNDAHPATNFFDSSVSDPTSALPRSPNYVNGMGVDVARIDASGILANGVTSATLTFSTSGDAYLPGVVTTQVDLFAPAFTPITKSVVDLNGHDPAWTGDVLEYTVTLSNTGGERADKVTLLDPLPAGVTFVPGSISYPPSTTSGATPLSRTDAPGDDPAEYDPVRRAVVARLGTAPTGTTGGSLAPNATTSVRFRVTVDNNPQGTVLSNQATVTFLAPTIGTTFTYLTNVVSTTTTSVADLKVVKQVLGDPYADNPIDYRFTVTNAGPATGTDVVAADRFPAGLSLSADPVVTPDPGVTATCAAVGGGFDCTAASMPAGSSFVVDYRLAVAPTAADMDNTVTVTASQPDSNTANNSSATHAARTLPADIWVTAAPNPDKGWIHDVVAGEDYLVFVRYGNQWNVSAAQDSMAYFDVPAGVALVSSTMAGCEQISVTRIACPTGNMPTGAFVDNQYLTLHVDPSMAPGTYDTLASEVSATPEANPLDNTQPNTINVLNRHDLRVTKTLDTADVTAGATAAYTVQMTNNGPSSTTLNPTVTDDGGAGLTLRSYSSDLGTCSATGGVPSCTVGSLMPGQSLTMHVVYDVAPDAPPALTNSAYLTDSADTDDTNNGVTTPTPVVYSADLALAKTADRYSFSWGEVIVFGLHVTNAGPSTGSGTSITDVLPDGVTFTGAVTGFSSCTPTGQSISCLVPDIAPGATFSGSFETITASGGTGSFQNDATLTDGRPDPNATDNTGSANLVGDNQAELTVTKAVSPRAPRPGQPATFTVTAHNYGPSDATAVVVTDELPVGFEFSAAGSPGCALALGTVTCALGTVPAGADGVAVITGSFAPDTVGTQLNAASVATTTTEYDPDNNTGRVDYTLDPVADLAVTVTPVTTTIAAGQSYPVTVTTTNAGPSTAASPVVTIVLAPGLTVTSPPAGCTITSQTLQCMRADLAPSGTDVLVITVTARSSAAEGGPFDSSVGVGTTTPESGYANNSASFATTLTNNSLLQIDKVGPASLQVGSQATYTILVTNAGDSDTPAGSTFTLSDPLPAGLTLVSANLPGGSCTNTTTTMTCQYGTLTGGTTLTATVVVNVTGAAGDPGTVPLTATNTVRLQRTGEPDLLASATTPVEVAADLELLKSAPTSVTAGESISYSLRATNHGPADAPVTLHDALPAGLHILEGGVVTDTGSCATSAGETVLDCDLGVLVVGSTAVVTVTAFVSDTLTPGTTLSNTATLTSPVTGPPGSRTSSATSAVTTSADLQILKYPMADPPVAGRQFDYVISGVNNGPSVARGVRLSDLLPAGSTFVSATPSQGTCSESGGTVLCDVGDLARGEMVSVQLSVAIDRTFAPQHLVNTSRITSLGGTPDPDEELEPTTNTSVVDQRVIARSTFAMSKTVVTPAPPAPTLAGQAVTYLITATNLGPSDATDAYIDDIVPLPVIGTVADAAIDGTGECALNDVLDDAFQPTGVQFYRCLHGYLAVGASMSMTYTIQLAPTATTFTNWACGGAASAVDGLVTQAGPPRGFVDRPCATATASPNPVVNLGITLASTPKVIPGSPAALTFTVTNPATGSGIPDAPFVDIALPPGATFDAAVGTPGGVDVTCTPTGCSPPTVTCDVTGHCLLSQLPPGASASVTMTVWPPPSARGPVDFTAAVGSINLDTDPGDNTASSRTLVEPFSELTVGKTVSVNPGPDVVAGVSTLTYTVSVTNVGPSPAEGVVLSDPIPAGLVISSATAAVQDGAATTTDTATCSITGQTVTCAPDGAATVPVNGALVATIVASVPADTVATTLSNVASATATSGPDGTTQPPATSPPVDNTVSLRTHLVLAKQVAESSVTAGGTTTYTLEVTNEGPRPADGTVIQDALPSGATVLSTTADPGTTCVVGTSGTTLDCTVSILPVGGHASVVVQVALSPDLVAGSTLVNTAAANYPEPEVDPGSTSRTAEVTSPVEASATVTVAKTGTGIPVAGADFTWTIMVTNAGPSTARSVVVTDSLPAAVAFVSSTPACAAVGADITCELGDLAVGSHVVTLVGHVAPDAAGSSLSNTATVTSTTADPGPEEGRSSTDTRTVGSDVRLALTKTVVGTVVEGRPVTYLLTLTNQGTSDAAEAQIADGIPAGQSVVSVTPSADGECTAGSGQPPVWTCAWAALPGGDAVTATLVVTLDPTTTAGASIANTASARTNEAVAADATASATVLGASDRVVSGRVFQDANGDGVAGPTEADIPLVTVELLGPGPDGILGDDDDVVLLTTQTHSPFVFAGLADGDYLVRVVPGPALAGLVPTTHPSGTTGVTLNGVPVTDVDFGYRPASSPVPLAGTGVDAQTPLAVGALLLLVGILVLALRALLGPGRDARRSLRRGANG